jgi:polyhydroxyalkanoate synthesis regulator protein
MVNVIRSYGGSMQSLVSGYLDQSLRVFTNQLRENRERAKSAGSDGTRSRGSQDEVAPAALSANSAHGHADSK